MFGLFKSKNKKQYEYENDSSAYTDYERRLRIEALKTVERLSRDRVEIEAREEIVRIEKMCRKIRIHELEKKMKEYGLEED